VRSCAPASPGISAKAASLGCTSSTLSGKSEAERRHKNRWKLSPELRIVPQPLWEAVQARWAARLLTARGHYQGKRPKYLLSGLLVCGECGSHYIVQSKRQNTQWYGYAAHNERGPAICTDGRMIRRECIERQLVDYVFQDMFTPPKLEFLDHVIERIFSTACSSPG